MQHNVYSNVYLQSLGVSPSKEQLIASGGICAICHEKYSMPVRLHCKHIFCEVCVSTWLDRERSCPLCRASITDDPIYRDGHTTHFIQLYWFFSKGIHLFLTSFCTALLLLLTLPLLYKNVRTSINVKYFLHSMPGNPWIFVSSGLFVNYKQI